MQLLTENHALAQVMTRIAALDLAPIKFKITSKEDGYGWTAEHVDRVELGYKRFLALLAMHPGRQIAPTRDIDKFWHAHILDTRKYAADCEQIFGAFLHHHPYLGMRGDEDQRDQAAEALHSLFEREFGEPVPANAAAAGAAAVDLAWCGGEQRADMTAAWCGGEASPDKVAAWCGGEAPVKAAAWCGGEAPAKAAAWCGGEAPAKAAAWCGGEVQSH
ncbi:hypothetical protein [Ideonella sp.]|uniref:glycine-rich domain-containing protein n=1 Tax=Ideonella sp. TaxID=1929293 RepID=UPI0035AE594B